MCGRGPRRRPGFGAGDPCLGGPAASCSCPIGHCLAPVDVISTRDSKPGTRPPVPGAPDAIASAGSRAGLRAGGQPSCLCHDESRRFWAKGRRLLRRQSPGCGRGPWPAGTPGRRVVSPPPPAPPQHALPLFQVLLEVPSALSPARAPCWGRGLCWCLGVPRAEERVCQEARTKRHLSPRRPAPSLGRGSVKPSVTAISELGISRGSSTAADWPG